ncbi:hypothetical protein [Ruminococcus callidus]|uniref:hypothetical protein n=1 Tax=Ruminococcus callidus TaxID=40519 RepID=UPI003521DCBE
MSTLLKMQKFHPLCSRCIGMYPLQNRWTVLRYLQCYENFSECCTHLILPETALFSPTPTFAKEPKKVIVGGMIAVAVMGVLFALSIKGEIDAQKHPVYINEARFQNSRNQKKA